MECRRAQLRSLGRKPLLRVIRLQAQRYVASARRSLAALRRAALWTSFDLVSQTPPARPRAADNGGTTVPNGAEASNARSFLA